VMSSLAKGIRSYVDVARKKVDAAGYELSAHWTTSVQDLIAREAREFVCKGGNAREGDKDFTHASDWTATRAMQLIEDRVDGVAGVGRTSAEVIKAYGPPINLTGVATINWFLKTGMSESEASARLALYTACGLRRFLSDIDRPITVLTIPGPNGPEVTMLEITGRCPRCVTLLTSFDSQGSQVFALKNGSFTEIAAETNAPAIHVTVNAVMPIRVTIMRYLHDLIKTKEGQGPPEINAHKIAMEPAVAKGEK
jgi:hypothetical protein